MFITLCKKGFVEETPQGKPGSGLVNEHNAAYYSSSSLLTSSPLPHVVAAQK